MCRNKEEIITLDGEILKEQAEYLFWNMTGFSETNPPSEYQLEEIGEIRTQVSQQLKINVLLQKCDTFSLKEDGICLEEQFIKWNIPTQITEEKVKKIVLFLIAQKSVTMPEDTLRALYASIWQNAYLDAARGWIRQELSSRTDFYVSNSVSPGFFGMQLENIPVIFSLLKGEQIGASCSEYGLVPEKSIIGMHLILDEKIDLFGKDCENCLAKDKSCQWCMELSE